MINYLSTFTNTDGNSFPGTAAVNSSGPGTTDGTEFIKAMIDDFWGFNQALLNYTDDTPNGSSEADGASQRLDSILKIVSNIDSINTTTSYTVEEWNKKGVLICSAGVGTVTLAAGTGADQTNRILVYNQTGSTITVNTGGVNDFIVNGEMIEYVYDGSSAFVRMVPNAAIVKIKADTDSDYAILDNDDYDAFEQTKTTAGGSSTYTLPVAANNTGRVLYFKLIQNSTGFADYLIVDGNGSETIDGEAEFRMNGDNNFLIVYSNGTEWKKISFLASYVTNGGSYINRTDWTSVSPGSNTTLNANSAVTHNLNVDMKHLEVKFYISEAGTNTSFEVGIGHGSLGGSGYGLTPHYTTINSLTFYTPASGMLHTTTGNIVSGIIGQNWYYLIEVTRRS